MKIVDIHVHTYWSKNTQANISIHEKIPKFFNEATVGMEQPFYIIIVTAKQWEMYC